MRQDERDLYEKYAAMDPVDVLQREEEEEYVRYVRERKRRVQRRRRREIMMRKRIRRMRMIGAAIAVVVIVLIIIVRAVTANPVRDVLTLQTGSPLPEASAFLKRQNSKKEIYYVSDMTQIDMSIAQDTPIIVEVNGKQYTSRLVVEDPNAVPGETQEATPEAAGTPIVTPEAAGTQEATPEAAGTPTVTPEAAGTRRAE